MNWLQVKSIDRTVGDKWAASGVMAWPWKIMTDVTQRDSERGTNYSWKARRERRREGPKRPEWRRSGCNLLTNSSCNWTGPHIYFDIMHCTCALWETFSTLKFVKSRTDRRLPRVLGHWWAAETCWGDSSCFKVGPVSFVDMFCFHYNLIWPKHGKKWKALPPFPCSCFSGPNSFFPPPTQKKVSTLCAPQVKTLISVYIVELSGTV